MTDADKIAAYQLMGRIRRFEQSALKYFNAGYMGGWLSLGIGQEGIAAGVRTAMTSEDHCLCGPRGLGHAIAAGIGMEECMAELMGKRSGVCHGKGGAYSMFSPERKFWGSFGVAAAQTPIAAGLAFALKYQKSRGVVVCFLGDGAANQGVYHEALNLVSLFGLPVVYVIENNGYAMGTSISRSSRFTECLARRAEAYAMAWATARGDDFEDVYHTVGQALELARETGRPSVVEIETYRFYGFNISDANSKKYRSPEEIEFHRENRDPLVNWKNQLLEAGLLDEETCQQMYDDARAEAAEAIRVATEALPPTPGDLLSDVYWEADHHTERSKFGRHFFD
ncbi:pyruvate dehydrogenase (acetyl-transferring) E1 component subunit alpha [Luteolibacter pohnpeiensis]|uniref:Pyruvate dehydrogenase (Acetyl-transferring) E1 component subunit alpha n=1 Tax=Luteolibacter pohnpeiensis TaxID=454153 RepID=A0A934VUC8_9BACT|nr:thiamine pyrophosphate-dependent enzyme [Luteolibacter pohnpeiensis]MBK1882397.1 pyruvate dehydrogenase (acetyl-transferring) E1 component subunit alpha [Luteolibacter pohnpeiensis]